MNISIQTPQSSLSSPIAACQKSATLAINQQSLHLQSLGKKIYKFGLGQSPFPIPSPLIQQLIKHATDKNYLPVQGLCQLRANIASWLNRAEHLHFEQNDVIIGPGSKQLIFQIGFVLDSQLIVQTPCWVSYIPQAKLSGKNVIKILTKYQNRWRVTPEELEQACTSSNPSKIKHFILTYPDNPTGLTYSQEQLKNLSKVARKHNIIIISDEIYGKLNFQRNHCSIARYYPEGTIILSGISKWVGAGGWRLGFAAFPSNLRWLLQAVAIMASETFTSVSAPIQYAACAAFVQNQSIAKYLSTQISILKQLVQVIWQKLSKTQILTHKPEGGFYIFLDFKSYKHHLQNHKITTSVSLCSQLLEETGIAVLPGTAFGRPQDQLTLRLAFVNFNGNIAIQAANSQEINNQFINKYCQDSVQGINKLVEWTLKL